MSIAGLSISYLLAKNISLWHTIDIKDKKLNRGEWVEKI